MVKWFVPNHAGEDTHAPRLPDVLLCVGLHNLYHQNYRNSSNYELCVGFCLHD